MRFQLFTALSLLGLIHMNTSCVADDATDAVREQVISTPASAPAAVAKAIKAAGPNAPLQAGPIVVAAIQALGRDAKPSQISAIIYAAVRVVPNSALRIVRAAVKVVPSAAPEIAAAAARAVPNPWKEVRYQGDTPPPDASNQYSDVPANNREPDFKSSATEDALAAVLDPADPGTPMTLAEAIVATAFDSAGRQGLAAVQSAVDTALYGDPGGLTAGDPKGISGVGVAGNSNTANEPRLPGTPPGGSPPNDPPTLLVPPAPNPPPVSP